LNAFGADTSLRDVGFSHKFIINADGTDFQIIFTTNYNVLSHTFNTDTNLLQFTIDAIHAKENIAEIIIPRDLFDGEFTILLNSQEIPAQINKTHQSSIISTVFDGTGEYTLDITATNYLGTELQKSNGGGCLIATAAFGSELSTQVQFLREIRDTKVLTTQTGLSFMNGFNQFYYSFSPAVADYERDNLAFKETVKIMLIPLLTSLTLLNYVDIYSEHEILGYGIGIILLNIGIYFVAPATLIMIIRKRVNTEKLDKKYV
tara:strand:- start:68 stop:850 length:783 start_codon:yes stop_codon:yes gene_type:complete